MDTWCVAELEPRDRRGGRDRPAGPSTGLAARAHEPVHLPGRARRPGLVRREEVHLAREILPEAEHVVADAAGRARGDPEMLHVPEALLARRDR